MWCLLDECDEAAIEEPMARERRVRCSFSGKKSGVNWDARRRVEVDNQQGAFAILITVLHSTEKIISYYFII